jgi:hypothetical protein
MATNLRITIFDTGQGQLRGSSTRRDNRSLMAQSRRRTNPLSREGVRVVVGGFSAAAVIG